MPLAGYLHRLPLVPFVRLKEAGTQMSGALRKLAKARIFAFCLVCSALTGVVPGDAFAQTSAGASAAPARAAAAAPAPALPSGVAQPPGYVIGPEDTLAVVYWREKDLSADVVVRPDGMISLPLLNDINAAGLTPEQLRVAITQGAAKFVEEPTVSVVVKGINSRKVFITGQVGKPGPYPLGGATTVLQLIATAGGVAEYADKKKIIVLRNDGGKQSTFAFNYEEVMKRKNLGQNIELKPGDTVIVP
jgi:polysaccharide export outer membrane protein